MNPKIDLNFAGENGVEEEEAEKRKKAADFHICVFPYEIGDRLFSHPLTVGKVRIKLAKISMIVLDNLHA